MAPHSPSPEPLAPLPQALLQLGNAPATPAITAPRSEVLIAQIEPRDAMLCRLMSRPSSALRARNTAEAQALINRTEPLRQELAQRTADGLRLWLDEQGQRQFSLRTDRLQNRIQNAGLVRVLGLLAVHALSAAQRRGIGVLLRDIGAHTPTLRAHLQLEESDLHGIQPIMLRDRLMSLARLELLQRGGRGRYATRNLRAETFQHAALVSRRFGYPSEHPPWQYMSGRGQDVPRVTLLRRLAALTTARRCGIDVQLP